GVRVRMSESRAAQCQSCAGRRSPPVSSAKRALRPRRFDSPRMKECNIERDPPPLWNAPWTAKRPRFAPPCRPPTTLPGKRKPAESNERLSRFRHSLHPAHGNHTRRAGFLSPELGPSIGHAAQGAYTAFAVFIGKGDQKTHNRRSMMNER